MAGRDLFAAAAQPPAPVGRNLFADAAPAPQVAEFDTGQQLAQPTLAETARSPQGVVGAAQEREARTVPELQFSGLLSGEDPLDVAKVSSALLTTTDPQEMGRILEATFPGKIGIIQDPEQGFLAVNKETGAHAALNLPGISGFDVLQAGATAAAFTPAARATTLGATLPAKAGIGAITSGLTETGLQAIQEELGGELNPEEIALATALGGVSETVIPAVQAFRQARQAKKLGTEREALLETAESVGKAEEATQSVARETGVDVGLFPAQKTQVPSEIAKQRIIPQLDAGSRIAMGNLDQQNKEVYDATVKLIDSLSPEVNVSGAPMKLRTAAKASIEAKKAVRKEASRFGKVIQEADSIGAGKNVDLEPVNAIVEDLFEESVTGGQLESSLKRVRGFLEPKGGRDHLTFRQLQRAKKEMDGVINSFGADAVDPSVKIEIKRIKNQLVDQMKSGHPPFKEASERFAKESIPLDELQNSIIGRIADIPDERLRNISSEIFNARTSVKDIDAAKKVINNVDPSAWSAIVRNEMDFRIGSMVSQIDEQGINAVQNLPSLIKRTLYGNPKQREVLLRSMDKQQRQNFVYLETVLGRASTGRAAGSPTASFTEIIKDMRGKLGVLKDIFTRPIKTIQNTGDSSLFDRKVKSLARVMFDKKWQPEISKIRKLDPKSPAAARAMSQLLNRAESKEEDNK